jgi:Alcohol dehydrogenase GroES-like domain
LWEGDGNKKGREVPCAQPFSGTAKSWSTRCPSRNPAPDRVLVKSLACGICGSDLHARKHAHRMVELTKHFPGRKPMDLSCDVVFGHEFCCEILDYKPLRTWQVYNSPPGKGEREAGSDFEKTGRMKSEQS